MRRPRGLPFLPLVPLVVVLVGLATALTVAVLGNRELRAGADRAVALRARVLSESLAARVRATEPPDWAGVLERSSSRTGTDLVLADLDGRTVARAGVVVLSPDEVRQMFEQGEGEARSRSGRLRYAVAALGAPLAAYSLVVLVGAPDVPFAAASLSQSIAMLTTLLVAVALLLALSLARAIQSDVEDLRARIAEMSKNETPEVAVVPVRGLDQVGLLSAAFNQLAERFTLALEAYRLDLARATDFARDRSEFLAALSHELRTPLNAILGFTDLLLAEVDGPLTAEARENLEVVYSSGQHLRALIDTVLELSALDSGQLRLQIEPCNVLAIVSEVVKEARVLALQKGLSLSLAGDPATIEADPTRLRQIIANLLGNAVKFTQAGGVIVSVSPSADRVRISVADTGPGISAEEQRAIFEAYRQVGDLQGQRKGSGLGLAIVRRLVDLHGGEIYVESRLGEGARFEVLLPIVPPPEARTGDLSQVPSAVKETHDES